MKKIIISCIFTIIVLFFACQKNGGDSSQHFVNEVSTTSLNASIGATMMSHNGLNYSVRSIGCKDQESFQLITDFCGTLLKKQIQPIFIILYSENGTQNQINRDNTIAFSAYLNTDKGLLHKLFRKNSSGEFDEDLEFNLLTTKAASRHFLTIMSQRLMDSNPKELSATTVSNKPIPSYENLDEFGMKIVSMLRSGLKNAPEGPPWDKAKYCSAPCSDRGCDCSQLGNGEYNCEPCICGLKAVEPYAVGNFSNSFINEYFDLNYYYGFRDNVMSVSQIGNKYILYYYFAGSVLNANLNSTVALQIAQALPSLKGAMDKLSNPNLHGTEVLIDNNFKSELVNLIAGLKSISSNQDYTDALNDVLNDINLFYGKSVNQILNEIK